MKRDAVGSRCCLGRFGYALARPGTTGRSSLGMRLVLPEVRIDRVIVVGWKEPIVQAVALGDADRSVTLECKGFGLMLWGETEYS